MMADLFRGWETESGVSETVAHRKGRVQGEPCAALSPLVCKPWAFTVAKQW